jgi:hypothetical protein
MTTSELHDLQVVLGRVLPDPGGFVERLLEQLLGRVAGTRPEPIRVTPGEVVSPDLSTPEPPRDVRGDALDLLAMALGACGCWGLDTACSACAGGGGPGWREPDWELFEDLIGPALARLPDVPPTRADEPDGRPHPKTRRPDAGADATAPTPREGPRP